MLGAVAFGNAAFGEGSGTILFDNVFCTGAETNITDCFHSGLGANDCSHFEDAGVRCQGWFALRSADSIKTITSKFYFPSFSLPSLFPLLDSHCDWQCLQ